MNDVRTTSGKVFEWPFAARQINDFEVEFLDDPWSDNPGIYSLNIKSKAIKRIRGFKKLDIPFDGSSKIDW